MANLWLDGDNSWTLGPENGEVSNPQRPQRRKVYPQVGTGPADNKVSDHKQAVCDNIDAWALWVSPPVFFIFNCIYWIAYRLKWKHVKKM